MKRELIDDPSEKRIIAKVSDDVGDQLDFNRDLYNSGDGYSPSRDLRRVASIPLVIVEKWKNELGVDVFNKDHASAVRRLLNSNEYLYLRTAPGRV